jgi:hypothetical protein
MAVIGFAACSAKTTNDAECTDDSDCRSGQVCAFRKCIDVCATDDDCPAGQICVGDSCIEGVRTDVPVVTGIDGDGSANSGTTHPNGTLTPHRIRNTVSITGEHLEGAEVLLGTGVESDTVLTVESSSENQIVATLPTSLAEGEYVLTVKNNAGAARTTTWVLQGEEGPEGPAPSQAEIQAAVSAMTNLDVPSLGGREAAGYQATDIWGRFIEGEDPLMLSASTIGESLSSGDVDDASGGQGRRGSYNNGTGVLAGFSSADLGELLATGSVMIEYRLMVPDNATQATTIFGTIGCHATRHDGSTAYDVVRSIMPGNFKTPDAWQNLTLRCDFAPGDSEQSISVEFTNDTVTDLNLDYVRISPMIAFPTYKVLAKTTADLGDHRPSAADEWADIANRTLTFRKEHGSTLLRLTYSDILGSNASGYDACRWRFLLDDASVSQFSAADDARSGTDIWWVMEEATHTAIVNGIPAGEHTFKVQVYRVTSKAASCLSGWNKHGNYLMVEELPQ